MLPDPSPVRIHPGKAEFGLLQSSAAAGALLRRAPPPPARPNFQSHPIQIQRTGLDRAPFRSEPPDLDPTAEIHPYPFALAIFVKEPLNFSIFNPQSICIQKYFQLGPVFITLAPKLSRFSTRRPVRVFCTLALGSNVYLCLGPRFLQKNLKNLVFLVVKPLNLVLGLVFAL